MKLKNWFGRKSEDNGVEHLTTRETDSFANGVLFELKAVVGSAIAQALQDKEGRYMRSILQESQFLLQAVSIKALDRDTARLMEEFMSTHETIESDFRKNFFKQILQPEYRSSGGARVKVSPDLVPVIEMDRQTLEPQTEDEGFILSLKGRRVRFEAHVVLEGPVRRVADAPASAQVSGSPFGRVAAGTDPSKPRSMNLADTPSAPFSTTAPHGASTVRITVHDRTGRRTEQVALPVVLGRDVSLVPQGVRAIEIDATFASRRQLLIFELMGQVYCFVPHSASLTFTTQNQQVLAADCLQHVPSDTVLRLTGGVPMDNLIPHQERQSTSDYPVIELQCIDNTTATQDATPRPRAV
ncbi:MAG: hypothetical protein ACOVO0_12685 [Burkholderiaceae bacterium]